MPSSLAKVDGASSESGVLFDALIAPYLAKIGAERRARVAGRIVDADFLLRQVTVFEIALDLAARSEGRVGIDALEEACRFKDYALDEIAESPLSALLGEARRQAWAEREGPTRPPGPAEQLLFRDGEFATEPREVLSGSELSAAAQLAALAARHAAAAVAQVAWEMQLIDQLDEPAGDDDGAETTITP